MFLVRYGYNALFVIVHVRCCPAAMVPVAATCRGPGLEASIPSPEKEVKGNVVVSVIVNCHFCYSNVSSVTG
jgi:hypothetical protein